MPSKYKLTHDGLVLGSRMRSMTSPLDNDGPDESATDDMSDVLALDNTNKPLDQEEEDEESNGAYDWSSDSDTEAIKYMVETPITGPSVRDTEFNVTSVVLLVDNREVKKGEDKSNLIRGLARQDIQYELRTLSIGDFAWMARIKYPEDTHNETFEVMLDVIIERKRLADLKESLSDGRYSEQKQRLRKCGISHVLYLVEGNNAIRADIKPSDLETAITSTHILDGFQVICTMSEDETVTMLGHIHQMLATNTMGFLTNMVFEEFCRRSSSSPPMRIRDIFAKSLFAIYGMTQPKINELLKHYETPIDLRMKYDATPLDDQQNMLKEIVGAPLSKLIWQYYNNTDK
eukprot:gene18034-21527_t